MRSVIPNYLLLAFVFFSLQSCGSGSSDQDDPVNDESQSENGMELDDEELAENNIPNEEGEEESGNDTSDVIDLSSQINPDLVIIGLPSDETEDQQPQPPTLEETALSYIAGGEDVLLVHGFGLVSGFGIPFANTDCRSYWDTQEDRIQQTDTSRNVVTIGYYRDDSNCEAMLPGSDDNNVFTSITDIAFELFEYISDEYTIHGEGVDIVAHSMGGIVVRKMLDDWGQQLFVDQVVTLGTPHGGHSSTIPLNIAAASFGCPTQDNIFALQCREMAAGSQFIVNLQPNPQSLIPTSWTLIATERDEVVGGLNGTGTNMAQGNSASPNVSRYTYSKESRIEDGILDGHILHGSLAGINSTRDYIGPPSELFQSGDAIDNPTTRVLNAID